MMTTSTRKTPTQWIERLLAAAAVLICLVADVVTWQQISLQQPIWPLPGLYLVEIFLVSVIGAFDVYLAGRADQRSPVLAWIASGMVLGLALVSVWSIGLFYFPVWAALLAAGAISARRRHAPVLGLIALSLVAGLFQAGLILWIASRIFMP